MPSNVTAKILTLTTDHEGFVPFGVLSLFEFVDGEAGIGHVAAGVHESNHFCRNLFEGILGELIAVVHESSQILEQRNFLANLLKFYRTELSGKVTLLQS